MLKIMDIYVITHRICGRFPLRQVSYLETYSCMPQQLPLAMKTVTSAYFILLRGNSKPFDSISCYVYPLIYRKTYLKLNYAHIKSYVYLRQLSVITKSNTALPHWMSVYSPVCLPLSCCL